MQGYELQYYFICIVTKLTGNKKCPNLPDLYFTLEPTLSLTNVSNDLGEK
jgi:hypothetical protein